MKLIVIGGNPAGLSAASAARRLHPDWIIDVYEMGGYISYASCGLPYYLSYGFTSDKLITLTKEVLLERRNIPVHIFHKVTSVDFAGKTVNVLDIKTDKEFKEKYDILMVATGGKAKTSPDLSVEHPRVFKMHTIKDADNVKKNLIGSDAKSGIIIGSGYIGLEMLEAYKELGIDDLTIIGPRLVFRSKSQDFIKKELEKNGVKVILGTKVKSLKAISESRLAVTLEDGSELESDFVQISIGVVPNTGMFKDSKLKMLGNGAILVDEFMRTNIENVYSGGDCSAVYHQILKKYTYIPLAPAANKQGRIAGKHMAGGAVDPFPGVVGTSIFKVFDLYCARTGINREDAQKLGYDVETVLIENNEIAHYYPGAKRMSVLLHFDSVSHLLLGAEITAPSALGAKKIDVLATALSAKMKIEDIQKLDLSYAPPFAPVWDPILIASNIARKKLK